MPIPPLPLPEQPHRRIPGTVGAVQQPPPVGSEGQRHPNGNTQSPATCGTAVSEVITRSRFIMIAAVSMNAPPASSTSSPRSTTGKCSRACASSSRPAPFCRLMRRTPGISANGANCCKGMLRATPGALSGPPLPIDPDLVAVALRGASHANAQSAPGRQTDRARRQGWCPAMS